MNKLQEKLQSDLIRSINIVKESNIEFVEFGIFGSIARNEYDCNSDIDIVIIVNALPDKRDIADLRCRLEESNCDLAVLLKDSFDNPTSMFHKKVKEDYRRIVL